MITDSSTFGALTGDRSCTEIIEALWPIGISVRLWMSFFMGLVF